MTVSCESVRGATGGAGASIPPTHARGTLQPVTTSVPDLPIEDMPLAGLHEWPRNLYDPFAGSGTTLIACEHLGRRAVCMEIDPAYVDVIRQRYADFTGQPQLAP